VHKTIGCMLEIANSNILYLNPHHSLRIAFSVMISKGQELYVYLPQIVDYGNGLMPPIEPLSECKGNLCNNVGFETVVLCCAQNSVRSIVLLRLLTNRDWLEFILIDGLQVKPQRIRALMHPTNGWFRVTLGLA